MTRRPSSLATSAGRLPLPALAVVALLLAGGCTGETPSGSPVATAVVELPKSYRFVPDAITVPVGTTVTWTNHDDFTHSVQFGDQAPLVMEPGASVSETFTAPGLFPYICSFHPRDMQGSVEVAADAGAGAAAAVQ